MANFLDTGTTGLDAGSARQTLTKMSSAAIRDLRADQLPDVVMPACEARPILRGQTAIVTGASSGIGRGIANALCAAGANVVVNYIGADAPADAVVHEATHCGCAHRGKAIAIKGDVSDENQVREMFARTVDEFGTVDILVNNAGLQQDAGEKSLMSTLPGNFCAHARPCASSSAAA